MLDGFRSRKYRGRYRFWTSRIGSCLVELPENKVGLVHISEVANEYVSDVAQYLKVKDTVKVKIISIDAKGKIALSVKQAQPKTEEKKEA